MAIKSKIFEDDTFVLRGKVWVNLTELYSKHSIREQYLRGLIEYDLSDNGKNPYIKDHDIKSAYNKFKRRTAFYETVDPITIPRTRISFLNGYYDSKGFTKYKKGEVPFTPFQIHRNYKEDIKKGTLIEKFIDEYSMRNKKNKQFLLEQMGLSMLPTNLSIVIINFSEHSTSGKGTFTDIMQKLVGHTKQAAISVEKFFSPNAGNFVMAPTKGKLWTFVDEAPKHIAKKTTELLKELADSKIFIPLEGKGTDAKKVFNSSNIVINTNNHIKIHNADDAIKLRLIVWEAEMNKDGKTLFTTKDIDNILNDKEGYKWLCYEATQAIFRVIARKGKRNEKFTIPDSHYRYWDQLAIDSKSVEIVEHSETLTNYFMGQVEFIPNTEIKDEFIKYKDAFPRDNITLAGFKSDLKTLITSRGIASVNLNARYKGVRGISFEWHKKWKSIYEEYEDSIKKESDDSLPFDNLVFEDEDITTEIGNADDIKLEMDEFDDISFDLDDDEITLDLDD